MSAPVPAGGAAPPAAPAGCPLCAADAAAVREVQRVPYARIWDELTRSWGARFSPAVVARHTPARDAVLVECPACGLRYFVPLNPGDAEFYAELSTTSAYYSDDKWEFGVVRDELARGARVLDVGCGDGNFLRALHGAARAAVGIDTNAEAVASARAHGLDARLATLEAFGDEHPAAFDVVCAFHVLEHLRAVGEFLRGMARCAVPGGAVAVSMPNRLRPRGAFEALDCPPHHVSQWDPRQFAHAARVAGLRLERVVYQPVDVLEARTRLRARFERAGGPPGARGARAASLAGRVLARAVFTRPLHPLLVRAGLARALAGHGFAMLAVFRVPE